MDMDPCSLSMITKSKPENSITSTAAGSVIFKKGPNIVFPSFKAFFKLFVFNIFPLSHIFILSYKLTNHKITLTNYFKQISYTFFIETQTLQV